MIRQDFYNNLQQILQREIGLNSLTRLGLSFVGIKATKVFHQERGIWAVLKKKMRDGIEKVVTNDIPIKQVKFCIQIVQTRTLTPQHRSEGSIVLSLGDRSDQIHSIFFTQNRVIIQHYIKKSIKSNIRRNKPKIFKVINETFFNNSLLSKEVT